MFLLPLAGGGASLEFAEQEFGEVKARLRAAARELGLASRLTRRAGVTLDTLLIAGERLTLSFEDGDPCIVSATASGVALMRRAVDGPEASLDIAAE